MTRADISPAGLGAPGHWIPTAESDPESSTSQVMNRAYWSGPQGRQDKDCDARHCGGGGGQAINAQDWEPECE